MKRVRMLTAAGLSLGLVTALQSGCAGNKAIAPAAEPQTQQAAQAPAVPPDQVKTLSGKVVEILSGGGYSYLCLEKDGQKSWAAISAAGNVKVGDSVELKPGVVMLNFTSKSLNRSFPEIVFSDGIVGGVESAPAMTKKQGAAPAAAMAPQEVAGKVVETMDAGGYTYVRLEQEGKSSWVAIPLTKVKVGDTLEAQPGMVMNNFTSKTLNRTFESIVFSSGLKGAGAAPAEAKQELPQGHPAIAAPAKNESAPAKNESAPAKDAATEKKEKPKKGHAMMGAPGVDVDAVSGKVLETTEGGGYTYLLLETGDRKVWAAVPPADVKVGEVVKLQPGMEMQNFKSKALNKTFDKVIFSGGLISAK